MKTMRERFEKLCKTNDDMEIFVLCCEFNEKNNSYENNTGDIDLDYYEDRLNGAWWSYQEQEERIDKLESLLFGESK